MKRQVLAELNIFPRSHNNLRSNNLDPDSYYKAYMFSNYKTLLKRSWSRALHSLQNSVEVFKDQMRNYVKSYLSF